MHKLFYIFIIGALFSCKSSGFAQQKDTKQEQKPKVEKPKFKNTQDQQTQVDPNTIVLTGIILEIKENTNICGKTYKASASVKVKRIVGAGSGIVNLISPDQEVTLVFENALVKDFMALQKRFSKNTEVTFKVSEDLCPDMSKTKYSIMVYNTKN